MTQDEWLTSTDPAKMLRHLRYDIYEEPVYGGQSQQSRARSLASDRKLRLWVGACRYLAISKGDMWVNHTLKESVYDWSIVNGWEKEVPLAVRAALLREIVGNPFAPIVSERDYFTNPHARAGVQAAIYATPRTPGRRPREEFQERVERHIFRTTWRTSSAAALARTIYDDRRWEDCPILADALEEAGCSNDAILTHLRGPGPHVRGCWVLDLILGKE